MEPVLEVEPDAARLLTDGEWIPPSLFIALHVVNLIVLLTALHYHVRMVSSVRGTCQLGRC